MPYYEMDPEAMEEFGQAPVPSGAFYDPAEVTFDFGRAKGVMRAVRDALVAKGFTAAMCHYDGGNDEGFAYFDQAAVNGVLFGPDELTELLKTGPLAAAFDEVYDEPSYPPEVQQRLRAQWEARPAEERIREALEWFADGLATSLLGEGYGTGEYTLRGQFRADLQTGRITDLEEAI